MFHGFVMGLVSSCSFGLIPLFTLPLMAQGLSTPSILFYRFLLAATAMLCILVLRSRPIGVCWRDMRNIGILCFFYAAAAVTFFISFRHLDSGLAATLQFSYPIYVVLFMTLFFKERARLSSLLAIVMTVTGVALLSLQNTDMGKITPLGIGIALLSAALNGVYVTGIQVVRLKVNSGLTVTFYLMLFGALYCALYAWANDSLLLPDQPVQWGELALLSIVTAVLSNLTLVESIKRIGATLASVLGALEPVTALGVGVLVFHEAFTWHTFWGVCLIIGAVMLIMMAPLLRRQAPREGRQG